MLATARLARSVTGDPGRVMAVAGDGVALRYAAYHGVFGAGAVVASQMLADPGPGPGEAPFLLLNMTEIARFAHGLALVAAAVVARRELPRGLWVTAAALLVLVFVQHDLGGGRRAGRWFPGRARRPGVMHAKAGPGGLDGLTGDHFGHAPSTGQGAWASACRADA